MKAYDAWTSLVAGSLGLFSPGRAMAFRHAREHYRSYTAAAKTGPNQRWRPKNESADALIRKDQALIISRCRDLARNNPYISGAIRKICNNVVRQGIKPQARNRKGDRLHKTLNDRLETAWARWSRRENADVLGHDSYYALQALVLCHLWVDGECIVHRVWEKDRPAFKIEVLECDLLDCQVDGVLPNGNIARRGIEYDKTTGRPTAYHIYDSHPGDYVLGFPKSQCYPAEDVIHVFHRERASQFRGVSWFAALVMDAFDLSEYQRFERIGAKLAAAFGIFLKSQYPEAGIGGIGGGPEDPPDYIEPGRIQKLPTGTEIQFASHKRPGETYSPYVRTSLKGLSAGSAMSYAAFANDYTESSYSAERSASLEERLSYQGQQAFLNEKLNDPVWAWFLEGLYWAGDLPAYPKNAETYRSEVFWQAPGWTWVDPLKDAKAAEIDIRLGITTRRRLAAQRGLDWDDTVEQLKREKEQMAEAGLLEQKKASE